MSTMQQGDGFQVDRGGDLISHVINRRRAVMWGLLCLAGYGGIFALDWYQLVSIRYWIHDRLPVLALVLLVAGLSLIGAHRRVILSRAEARLWQQTGWFVFSTAARRTSQWPLERFDRILIQRSNLLGLEAPTRGNPRSARPGIRFRVLLAGDSEVMVNSYRRYHSASQLANALSQLTGFAVHIVS
jgi:hypothetical protein